MRTVEGIGPILIIFVTISFNAWLSPVKKRAPMTFRSKSSAFGWIISIFTAARYCACASPELSVSCGIVSVDQKIKARFIAAITPSAYSQHVDLLEQHGWKRVWYTPCLNRAVLQCRKTHI